MPRTSDALGHFTFHHELVYLRNELQTSTYEGGDINTASYSTAARGFGAATVTYFEKLAVLGLDSLRVSSRSRSALRARKSVITSRSRSE